jgi:hypothetical protein
MLLRREATRQAGRNMPDEPRAAVVGVKVPKRLENGGTESVRQRREVGINRAVEEPEPTNAGRDGLRGKGRKTRGGCRRRNAGQKLAPVDLHAPALSSPASAGRVNHTCRTVPSSAVAVRDFARFAQLFKYAGAHCRPRTPLEVFEQGDW